MVHGEHVLPHTLYALFTIHFNFWANENQFDLSHHFVVRELYNNNSAASALFNTSLGWV